MKNISLKVWAPVVLVIVAAGGIISWYYWPDGTKVSTDSIIKEPWQTYRNEKYGFELMYPDGFVLNTETVRPVHGTNDMIGSSFPDIEGKIVAQSGAQIESSAPPVIGFDIFPSVTVFEGNAKSLEEYTRQLADYRDLPFGEIFINNIPAYKITYGRQTEEVYFEVYFQNAAADVIRFWYTDIFCLQYKETVCTKKAENNLANQVLSTFRFIDNSNPQVERNKPITNQGNCLISGCSNQLCVDEQTARNILTTCEWLPEYACYGIARCERQPDGQCGWTPTPELTSCLANP